MSFVIAGNSASTGYNLTRSLRFRASASAYLNRTPASATNRQKFTISVWYKAGGISAGYVNANILNAGGDGSSVLISGTGAFGGTYQDRLLYREGGTTLLYWNMVFRDPASWYHIVFAMDTTQATAANRTKLYVNGVDQGAFSGTAITQNASTSINNTSAHYINTYNGTFYPSDLYYTEYNFVDGQQLTPSSFGSTNATTGVWQPARYTGTYGTNGFYLPFTDNSALTTSSNVGLGKDFSGNANYWVTNNISITAGVTYDSMTDVPTLTSATASNFAVLNPLNKGGTFTLSDANLTFALSGSSGATTTVATIGVSSGKFYWEMTVTGTATYYPGVGVDSNPSITAQSGSNSTGYVYLQTGDKLNNGSLVAYGASFTTSDVIGVALNMDAGTLTFYKNNTSQGQAYSGLSGTMFPVFVGQISGGANANFGQRPFSYTPPTGFVALNTYNLPTSTIVKGNTVMDATLWAGDNTARSITNTAAFKPDLVWIKDRTTAGIWNVLFDSVRGAGNQLSSNQTDAELASASNVAGKVSAFNSNGFSVATGSSSYYSVNQTAENYVGWQWQAGQGSSSSNTNGSITSTVSVNASAGFSIATFTGNASVASFGHGLGVTPALIIIKNRSTTGNWCVGVNVSTLSWNWNTDYLYLNSTIAKATDGGGTQFWSAPTSTLVNIGGGSNTNGSGNAMVAYCWTPIAGYSAFGSYTGNGSSDGAFVYLGFRPKFVMIKSTSTGGWVMLDTSRDTYNIVGNYLYANSSAAEATSSNVLDINSNGFKIRNTWTDINGSGTSYVYAAFAETPFKNSLAR